MPPLGLGLVRYTALAVLAYSPGSLAVSPESYPIPFSKFAWVLQCPPAWQDFQRMPAPSGACLRAPPDCQPSIPGVPVLTSVLWSLLLFRLQPCSVRVVSLHSCVAAGPGLDALHAPLAPCWGNAHACAHRLRTS